MSKSNRKTSLRITRNEDGSCDVRVTFSDKDKDRQDDNAVLWELLADASTTAFYDFTTPNSKRTIPNSYKVEQTVNEQQIPDTIDGPT